MKRTRVVPALLGAASALLLCVSLAGCRVPGKPLPGTTPKRPDQVTDFAHLYSQNCAACHGPEGRGGAALPLNNPAYIAYAGEKNIENVTAQGIGDSLMPGFSKSVGGLLTDQQVQILAHGITAWGGEAAAQLHPPPYFSQLKGDPATGMTLFRQDCLHCHAATRGSILDPVYVKLLSDGGMRSWIVAGAPHRGMPDWRSYPGGPLTDQQISDIVAFYSSLRTPVIQPQPPALPQPTGAQSPAGTQAPAQATAPEKP